MLLDFLRSPEAYRALGLQGQEVRTIETHHAWVFLFGDHALKLKKPVRTRWLDFSTPALREAACRQELRLNQALAPGVYLDLVRAGELSGSWHLQRDPAHAAADESAEDWLVLMRRLPEDRMLDHLIGRKALCPEAVDRLARVLCSFWSSAPKPSLAPGAWLERMQTALAQHAQALACQAPASPTPSGGSSAMQIQQAVDGCQRLLQGCARDIEQRVTQGRVVCGHGDLRPEHVHLPERPGRPLVIDRLEFNDALREVDPFEELSFLAVECRRLGAPWVGRRLFARCGRLLGDRPPHRLLRLYTAQRSLLRARLALAHLQETPVRDGRRWHAQAAWYIECAGLATGVLAGPGAAIHLGSTGAQA